MATECVERTTPSKVDTTSVGAGAAAAARDSAGNPSVHIPTIRVRLADVRSLQGWDLNHPYVETFWLPILGPTSTLLLRFVGRHVHGADYVAFDNRELAMSLGLGAGSIGQTGPVVRSIKRLVLFRLATVDSADGDPNLAVTIPPKVPVVRESLRKKWPQQLHVLHRRVVAGPPAAGSEGGVSS